MKRIHTVALILHDNHGSEWKCWSNVRKQTDCFQKTRLTLGSFPLNHDSGLIGSYYWCLNCCPWERLSQTGKSYILPSVVNHQPSIGWLCTYTKKVSVCLSVGLATYLSVDLTPGIQGVPMILLQLFETHDLGEKDLPKASKKSSLKNYTSPRSYSILTKSKYSSKIIQGEKTFLSNMEDSVRSYQLPYVPNTHPQKKNMTSIHFPINKFDFILI